MAITWNIKTETVNELTALKKIVATRTEGEVSLSFSIKALMKTKAEKDKVWDAIWKQYKNSLKVVPDSVISEGKINLETKEVI